MSNYDNTNSGQITQPRIAGMYVRVSTKRQEDEETIESQMEEVKARIVADGNIISPENIFQDDGWTGEMLQRPGLDQMRDAAIDGKFQILYVYDRGRLSRVFAYQEIIIEELIDKGLEFVTLHDVKAETPEERVLQAMQGVFHEYERVKIAERMRRGKLYKARAGTLINGHSIYGYNYIKKTDTIPAHYEINEDQAKVVRMLFQWVGFEGISLREAIKRLYDKGIPPRKEKSEFWTKGPLVRLLQRDTYVTGKVYYNKSEAIVAKKPIKNQKYKKIKRSSRKVRPREDWIPYTVPTLFNDSYLFEKVQKILENNQKFACKKRKHEYLLSGVVYCECGNRRVGDGIDKENFYYRCAERIYKFPIEKKCKSQGINAVALDKSLWNELMSFLSDPNKLKEATEKWLLSESNNTSQIQEKTKREAAIAGIKEEKQRYAKAYGVKTLEFDQLKELVKDANRREQVEENALKEINTLITQRSLSSVEVDKICFEVEKILKTMDFTNKFQVIKDIITKITVKGGQRVEVKGRLPLFALNMGYETISRNCRVTKCWKVHII